MRTDYLARVERLRECAVASPALFDEFLLLFYRYLDDRGQTLSFENYGEAFAHTLLHVTPVIEADELIVGRTVCALSPEDQAAWANKYAAVFQALCLPGQGSHMTIDYDLVLHEGVNGVLAKIDAYTRTCTDPKKQLFYRNCSLCLQAVNTLATRYADHAQMLADTCTDPVRKAELSLIAENCRRVPANPATTFYEAVQSVHFITHCISFDPYRGSGQQFQLGRPDRYLWPYYIADRNAGTLTADFAQLLIDCLGIQINHRVPHGLSSGYMVGGRDQNGNTVANDLTFMALQSIDDLRLVYPAVGLCYTADMPDRVLQKACEVLSHGRSHPALFNDEVISAGLRYYGVPETEVHDYIHSTCVEITPIASSNVWVASPYTNMPQLLLDCMDREYENMDALKDALFACLTASIQRNFEQQNDWRAQHAQKQCFPLLSCFVNDCLACGTDIEAGGARYNWIMPSFVGIGNLIDSLYAINEMVFVQKEVSLLQFKEILAQNFQGHEAFREKVLHKLPKYGNDDDAVDTMFGQITEFIVAECQKYKPMHQNASLIPSVFCWIMHERLGARTGATPDGRLAGFPLGDGSGPCQGRERCGPTASILSSTKWSHKELIGGVAVNLKFSKKDFTHDSFSPLLALIKTYMQRGGFELQINVVDRDTLLAAQKNPDAYRDLVVRIGGYSDYFVTLSPNMQAEVLQRTTHTI